MSAPARRWLATAVLRSTWMQHPPAGRRAASWEGGPAATRRCSSGSKAETTAPTDDRNLCGWRPAPGEQPQQVLRPKVITLQREVLWSTATLRT